MKKSASFGCFALIVLTWGFAWATDLTPGRPSEVLSMNGLERLAGQPVDIAPWAYRWRADLAVQENPEAWFIPRRLERLDTVYRTAFAALPQAELKSVHYDMPDLLQPLLPRPKGQLQTGLLWTGGVVGCQVELEWPDDLGQIPSPEAIEVRIYPTSFGWFGWTVDRVLGNPRISQDKRTWTYKSDPAAKMDSSYSTRVDAATEMVAVFYEKSTAVAPPTIRVTGPGIGAWKRMDLEIEWGFQPETEKSAFDGRLESSVAILGPILPLAKDRRVKVKGGHTWKSHAVRGAARRGISVPLLYASGNRPGLDSRITVRTKEDAFTFRVGDLDDGPILLPERGIFVTKAGSGQTGRQFAGELAAKNLKSVRQMTREHREAASTRVL